MNPLFSEAVGAILRAGLQVLAGYLVTRGIWTADAAETYVAGAAIGLLSLGWSLYQKYGMRSKLVTALSSPQGSTENNVKALIGDPYVVTPSVTTPANAVPAEMYLK
jgi:hypothetical protein